VCHRARLALEKRNLGEDSGSAGRTTFASPEARLGRQLGFLHGDFAGVPSVEGFPCSETLRKRYGLKVRKARKPVKRTAKKARKRTA
jgi:hypothetical protein